MGLQDAVVRGHCSHVHGPQGVPVHGLQGPVHVSVLRGVEAVSGGAALELLGPGEGHLLSPGLTGGQLTSERVAIVPTSPVYEAGQLT